MQATLILADSGLTGLSIFLGLAIGFGIALLFLGLQRAVDGQTNTVSRRLNDFVGYVPGQTSPPAKAKGRGRGRRQRQTAVYTPLEKNERSGYTLKLSRELARADLKITVGEFLVLSLALASVGALIGYALPIGGHIVLALALFGAGIYLPRWWVGNQRKSRQNKFNAQLADVISIQSGALRSGFSLMQSMELVAREGPNPVAKEFERVVREVGLGLSPEEALSNLVERMQSDDLELLVTAINVQREVGGNLVEVLDTIANTIRERVKLLGQVRVLTAQQQFSGYIIALLPVALALLLGIINPTYMLGVFTKTTYCGWTMLGCSSISVFAGFLVIRRIVNIKV